MDVMQTFRTTQTGGRWPGQVFGLQMAKWMLDLSDLVRCAYIDPADRRWEKVSVAHMRDVLRAVPNEGATAQYHIREVSSAAVS